MEGGGCDGVGGWWVVVVGGWWMGGRMVGVGRGMVHVATGGRWRVGDWEDGGGLRSGSGRPGRLREDQGRGSGRPGRLREAKEAQGGGQGGPGRPGSPDRRNHYNRRAKRFERREHRYTQRYMGKTIIHCEKRKSLQPSRKAFRASRKAFRALPKAFGASGHHVPRKK